MTKPKLADTVFYRSAPDYKFKVDGEQFPWHISEPGATFTRILNELYRVDICLYGIRIGSSTQLDIICHEFPHRVGLEIGDMDFPWVIAGEGYTIHRSRTSLSTVKLGFLAVSVDTDTYVHDARRGTGKVFDINGHYWGEQPGSLTASITPFGAKITA